MAQINKDVTTIHLPNIQVCLNKEMLGKEKKLAEILKDTPFEKDTNIIFEHLVKIKGAMHISGERTEHKMIDAKRKLELIRCLLILFHPDEKPKIKGNGYCINIPKEMLSSAKDAAIKLYNEDLELCHQWITKFKKKDVIKNGTPQIYCIKDNRLLFKDKEDDEFCESVTIGEYRPVTDRNHLIKKEFYWKKIKSQSGKKTYIKNTPYILTDEFRQLCAIKIFCVCDGYQKWGEGKNKERNECIFKCLKLFGYVTDSINTKKEEETKRQYIKERVRDAESRKITFISPPL